MKKLVRLVITSLIFGSTVIVLWFDMLNNYAVGYVSRDARIWNIFDIFNGDKNKRYSEPLLTLFTTFRDRASKKVMYDRLLQNWGSLSPGVIPVLFQPYLDNSTWWTSEARSRGWEARMMYHLRDGVPLLKAMFHGIEQTCVTPFYGYANADMLFDESLLHTLNVIKSSLADEKQTMVLIIGKKRNLNITMIDVGNGSVLQKISEVGKMLTFGRNDAIDYFIISRHGFPWNRVPDVVIGRPAYDNWLVASAIKWNLTVIDASRTLLALHQEGAQGAINEYITSPEQFNMNRDLFDKDFNFGNGRTDCANYKTICSTEGAYPCHPKHIQLSSVESRSPFC